MPRVAAAQYSRAMRDPEDVVDPIDRKVHDILVHIMETTTDEGRRQRARDLRFTLPPVKDWPDETLRAAYERFMSDSRLGRVS